MNEWGIDFNELVENYHRCLSENDPNSRNYNKEMVVWRKGQLFFNLMTQANPRVAELLRGSFIDPFHRDEVSNKVWDFVMDKWEAEAV